MSGGKSGIRRVHFFVELNKFLEDVKRLNSRVVRVSGALQGALKRRRHKRVAVASFGEKAEMDRENRKINDKRNQDEINDELGETFERVMLEKVDDFQNTG